MESLRIIKTSLKILLLNSTLAVIVIGTVVAFKREAKMVAPANYSVSRNQPNQPKQPTPTLTVFHPEPTTGTTREGEIINPELDEWGKAVQVDETTWQMKLQPDEKIATATEIYEALNSYRARHGSASLNWDSALAGFAQQRADYFNQAGGLDSHAGFVEFTNNPENILSLGANALGENSSFGYELEATHLVEWAFAGDEPHNLNQLNPEWNSVGVGVSGLAVDVIFGTK